MSPVMAARQWKYTLEKSKVNVQTTIRVSTLFAFCGLLARTQENPSSWSVGVAAAVTLAMIPYTVICILLINKRLVEIAGQPLDGEKSASSGQEEVSRLIRRWETLNWIRSLFWHSCCICHVIRTAVSAACWLPYSCLFSLVAKLNWLEREID